MKLNPRSPAGLDNKATVLSEYLGRDKNGVVAGRTREAIAVLDTKLKYYPDDVAALASRGVLYARLGERAAAQRDARDALQRDPSPVTQYQVAGVYALTAAAHPEDRREALRLLAAALAKGQGLEDIDDDPDLGPLRQDDEFRELVDSAKALRATAAGR